MPRHREALSPSGPPLPAQTSPPRCRGCAVGHCPAEKAPQGAFLAGWRLGLISMVLFLGPVVLAIAGAISLGGDPGTQFAGAITGLGLGLAGSVGIARIVRRAHERTG